MPPDDKHRLVVRASDGVALIADVRGPQDGVPLVLLHGGGQSRHIWQIAAERFAALGYKSAVTDLRGHGDSDWSQNGNYQAERFVTDLLSLVEKLGSPAVLVGASFGGHISLLTASHSPSSVRALVLCDVTPWIEGDKTKAIRMKMRGASTGYVTIEDAASHLGPVVGTDSDLKRIRRRLRVGSDGRFYWRWDPQFFTCQEEESATLTATLQAAAASLSVPTLLIRASLSEIVTEEQVLRFVQTVPGCTATEISGARHTVRNADNEAYAAIIAAFLHTLRLELAGG